MSAKQRDSGSKIEQYAAKPAAYDQLYSSGGRSAGEREASINRKESAGTDRMLERIKRDPNASDGAKIAAAQEQSRRKATPGYVNGRGIKDAEQNRNQDSQTADKKTEAGLTAEELRKQQIEAVQGKSPTSADAVENGANAVMPTPPLRTPDNNPADTSLAPAAPGAPAAPAGQGATDPATTPPVAQGGAANGKPAVPDWRQERAAGLDAQKKQFAIEKFGKDITDWTVNDPEDQGKKSAQIFKYGESLGISPEQIEAQADKARNGQVAEAKEKSKTLDMESKFDAMIADRPADQKAMFSKMSEKDKAAMVQKNESLKMVREEEAKLGPDKNSNAEQAKALIPGAKKEVSDLVSALDSASNSFMDPMGDIEFQVDQMRESRGALDERASTEIGDKLQLEVVPDNVKAARESLSGLDGGGWNLAKGQEMLDQQANANKPSPPKEDVPQGPRLSQTADDGLGWLTPGVDPKAAARKLKFAHGYSDENITEILNGRGITESAAKDKKGQDLVAAEKKAQDIFDESAIRNPPNFSSEALKGTVAGNVWDWFQDSTGERQSAIDRQKKKLQQKNQKKLPPTTSIDNKLQQRAAAYQAPINDVLERSNFLQRYA